MVPELVGKLTGLGYTVAVEPGAGEGASYFDDDYAEAGAEVSGDALSDAELVVSVNPLSADVIRRLPEGTSVLSFLPTNQVPELVSDMRDAGVTAFAMELVPRISRAQSMDALSSQALVAGYRCAIVAAGRLRRFFPLNMTAAGPIPAAGRGRRARRRCRRVAGDRDVQASRRCREGVRRARRRRRGDPLDGRHGHR